MAAAGASGTWEWDIANGVLKVDEHFADLYAIDDKEDLTRLPTSVFFSAIHPADKARIRIAVAGMLAGAELFSKEFRVVTAGGATLWMHGRGHCVLDERDEPVRFSGLLVDVTERKRAEERLHIAQTAGGVGTFEYIDGHATANVSNEFCILLGLHPAPVLPIQTINSVLHEGEGPILPDPRTRQAPDNLESVFCIHRRDDGEPRWIARRGEVLNEGSGYRLVGVIYDVTKAKEQEAALVELNESLEARVEQEVAIRREAEDALRQAQKMEAVGQLTGGIAHDFNNLLMAISSSLALLRKRLPEDPGSTRLIDNALQGAERGAALTQRMLAFARRQDLKTEAIDLSSLIAGMKDLIQRTIGPAWSLEIEMPVGLTTVAADANQVELALLNLAVNARDALADGGVITITAAQEEVTASDFAGLAPGRYVALQVIDQGAGMDAETLAKAMDPFFTTKGVGKGTGLGLSMVHGLAKQLGGTFQLQSKPGEGTTASLWLPASNEAAETAPAPALRKPAAGVRPLKILAVDDDALILMNTAAMLEDQGHEVLEARSGAAALQTLKQHSDIDLLVTDQAMPNMTGAELIGEVAQMRPGLPIILATGYGELPSELQQNALKLAKPYGDAELAAAIAKAVQVASR
jgi:signal transduction histidine kinase/CheY-like chemotaxis protein